MPSSGCVLSNRPVQPPSPLQNQLSCLIRASRKCVLASAAPQGDRQRHCVLLDRTPPIVDYEQGWSLQKRCLQQVKEFAGSGQPGHDYLIILQHHPVFTLGAGSSEEHVNFDLRAPPLPVHRVERGGEVTYHGPGQLVLYPILDLQHHRKDLHWYMRSLEEVAIRTLSAVSGLEGERIQGLTGVWVGGRKVAAIGVRAQRWVTYHGMSLNVDMDLAPFSMIVPCGISDRGVTMVSELEQQQHGNTPRMEAEELLAEYKYGLLESFSEVFGVQLLSEGDVADVQQQMSAQPGVLQT